MRMRKERTEAYAFSDRCVRPGSGGMGRTTVLGNVFLNGRSDPACGWNSHESRVLSEETRPPVSVRMAEGARLGVPREKVRRGPDRMYVLEYAPQISTPARMISNVMPCGMDTNE